MNILLIINLIVFVINIIFFILGPCVTIAGEDVERSIDRVIAKEKELNKVLCEREELMDKIMNDKES